MYDDNSLYWIWLAEKCGVASKEFARLIGRFEDPFEIYRLDSEEIGAIDCISERLKNALSRKSLESAYSILKYCKHSGVDIISYGDKRYPSRLKTLEDPPAVLYCLGRFPDFDKRLCVGIVGTRKISAYGIESSYKIAYELAAANVCVVSGMALGVDAIAACGALEAGGDTVAVLGCGIDVVYPKSHAKLEQHICRGGAVITEYPPSEAPCGKNFPKRNRIISGLCQGVLVVEGNRSSGAMITAQRAVDQGREVFALPGKINESNSEGPNELIKQGANVALRSDDIILHYDFLYHDTINYRGLKRAKSRSDYSPRAVRAYGVSTDVYFGAAEAISHAKSEPVDVRVGNAEKMREPLPYEASDVAEANERRDGADSSRAALENLDEVTRRVFELMPIDRGVAPDEFTASGIGIAEAITALTMLEISGLVSSLPGGTYIRK